MTLFPSLQRYPSPHMPRIGHVPYIFNIITCTVTAMAYYHIAKQTSNPIDIAYRSLSSYGIFWFIGGYITKWLRQMLDAKADQSKSTNVKPAVPTAKKTKLQDLEMGIKEAASQEAVKQEDVSQDGATHQVARPQYVAPDYLFRLHSVPK